MRASFVTLALLLGAASIVNAQTGADPGISSVSGPAGPQAGVPVAAPDPARCLETPDGSPSLAAFEFEGSRFEAIGIPEPIQAVNLESMGTLGELPVYAGRLTERPVVDLWVPVCQPAGQYQLFTRAGV